MEKLKIGLIGCGRLGKKYAEIIHHEIKNAVLLAVSSIVEEELDYAQNVLGIKQVYQDYHQMLALNELDAVFILSSTDAHARQFIDSLEAGFHVFCEKPLALNVSDCQKVIDAARRRPNQLSMIGFVRRYDDSYQYAHEKVTKGTIGRPILVKSQTMDLDVGAKFQAGYTRKSGGIFLDYNVHDIDLVRWYTGSEITSVYSIGGTYKHQVFKDMNDADNVLTTCKLENGAMAIIQASRTTKHGHDTYTEIMGTEGSLRIGRPANLNRVEIYDGMGMRQEAVKNFYERFEDAFKSQMVHFINSALLGRKIDGSLDNALEATRVGVAMTKSFLMKKEVEIER